MFGDTTDILKSLHFIHRLAVKMWDTEVKKHNATTQRKYFSVCEIRVGQHVTNSMRVTAVAGLSPDTVLSLLQSEYRQRLKY